MRGRKGENMHLVCAGVDELFAALTRENHMISTPARPGTFSKKNLITINVAFTGEAKLVGKAIGYEQEKAEAPLSSIGFAGCASRAFRRAHWSVSVTHRFLRRGFFCPGALILRVYLVNRDQG